MIQLFPYTPNIATRNSSKKVSFSAMRTPQAYNTKYQHYGSNGIASDEFVTNKIKEFFPNPKNTNCLDIGAGDGRNCIPIAKLGYNVTAYELSDAGRGCMAVTKKKNALNNLSLIKQDILIADKNIIEGKKYDVAYMSHVSQHFSEKEMEVASKNIFDKLKDGGMFIFDALISNEKSPKNTLSENIMFNNHSNGQLFNEDDLVHGNNGFYKNSLIDGLKAIGFKLIDIQNYDELKKSRAPYLNSPEWGGPTAVCQGKIIHTRPVILKWLVFKK